MGSSANPSFPFTLHLRGDNFLLPLQAVGTSSPVGQVSGDGRDKSAHTIPPVDSSSGNAGGSEDVIISFRRREDSAV